MIEDFSDQSTDDLFFFCKHRKNQILKNIANIKYDEHYDYPGKNIMPHV